ncbi:MAG TPA: hypothetical protein V6C78_10795 [Crinalium sp.]|jgi:hypothetical protein
MFTGAVNRSDVDIETYFDSLDLDASDFDTTHAFTDATNAFIKGNGVELTFHLPEPTCSVDPAQDLKQPLDQVALEQAAYEVRLLARQLESSPFMALEFTEERYVIPEPPQAGRSSTWFARSVVLAGLLLSSVALYAHYNRCSTALTCLKTATHQVAMLSHYTTQSVRVSSHVIASRSKVAPQSTPFRDAVNQAMRAAVLTQTATAAEDWETVANTWLEAIRLMNTIPVSDSKYSTATLKIEEYARNLAYAQSRMREAAKQEKMMSQVPKP